MTQLCMLDLDAGIRVAKSWSEYSYSSVWVGVLSMLAKLRYNGWRAHGVCALESSSLEKLHDEDQFKLHMHDICSIWLWVSLLLLYWRHSCFRHAWPSSIYRSIDPYGLSYWSVQLIRLQLLRCFVLCALLSIQMWKPIPQSYRVQSIIATSINNLTDKHHTLRLRAWCHV